MALLQEHLSVHIVLLLADLIALKGLGLSLLLRLYGLLPLQKLLLFNLVISKLGSQASPEVVSIALTAPQLVRQVVIESLHTAAVSSHLHSQVLHSLLLVTNDILLFIQLNVEKTLHFALVF